MSARYRLAAPLSEVAREDPLAVIFHFTDIAERQHLASIEPTRLHERLSALPWRGLLDPLLPARARAKAELDTHARFRARSAVVRAIETLGPS